MQATALGHRLETLHDGLTTFCDGNPVPVPLVASNISVRIVSGVAFVQTTRSFHNTERNPIEAVMTFPVGFDAVVTGLAATIDGRRMIGVAKERSEARETYEAALDEGKLSVLHEEALRGIHVLSVGALPPGAKVLVELEQTVPLADVGGVPFLRLPMTAGQLYGTSPLLPSDDLVTADVRHVADISVTVDAGCAMLHGEPVVPDQTLEIVLDRAVELLIEGGSFGQLSGTAADGRKVTLALEPIGLGDAALDLHVIVDRSGSTSSVVQDGTISVWQAMRDGLEVELAKMRAADRVSLWQFDDDCQFLGASCGPASAKLAKKLEGPSGGTELAGAIRAALAKGARDILVLTDGQTWAHMVEELKGEGPRISAILAGPGSLDANIGHLCALTGGQVLYAPGRDVASALRSAFAALRQVGAAVKGEMTEAGPANLTALRGGVRLQAAWSTEKQEGGAECDAIGRFAAALALPLMATKQAESFARAHSLCTHMTSLVLVDDAGEATEGFSRMRKVPLMESMSASLGVAASIAPPLGAMHSMSFAARRMRSPSSPSQYAPVRLQSAIASRTAQYRIDINDRREIAMANGKSPKKGALRRILDWLRREKKTSDLTAFDGFAWDTHGDALLADDLTMLDVGQIVVVKEFTQRISAKFSELGATSAPIDNASILALGLIAHQSAERIAERFARRALKDAPPWLRDFAGAKQ